MDPQRLIQPDTNSGNSNQENPYSVANGSEKQSPDLLIPSPVSYETPPNIPEPTYLPVSPPINSIPDPKLVTTAPKQRPPLGALIVAAVLIILIIVLVVLAYTR